MEIILWIIGIYCAIHLLWFLFTFCIGLYAYIAIKKEDKDQIKKREIREQIIKEINENKKRETNE